MSGPGAHEQIALAEEAVRAAKDGRFGLRILQNDDVGLVLGRLHQGRGGVAVGIDAQQIAGSQRGGV